MYAQQFMLLKIKNGPHLGLSLGDPSDAILTALLIGAGGTGGTDGTGDPKIPETQISMLILGQLNRNALC